MNKKRILLVAIIGILLLSGVFWFWWDQRQQKYTETLALLAPIYTYSGKLNEEERVSFSEFISSLEIEPSQASKYTLSRRERLQLEAHSLTLYRNNPELMFVGKTPYPKQTDTKPYIRHFGILTLVAKTKLAELPAISRGSIISPLQTFEKRLIKNSVEACMKNVKESPSSLTQKLSAMAFGIESITTKDVEGGKHGIVLITDTDGIEYEVDLDDPLDVVMTEDTNVLHSEIDRIFERLTDEEFERLENLSSIERLARINELFPEK